MRVTESTIIDILQHPEGRDWSIQGLGMLRLYLDDEHKYRLHVWDPLKAELGVSTIHDHPWDFSSVVLSGEMRNTRYLAQRTQPKDGTHYGARLFCGVGGYLMEDTIERYSLIPKPDRDDGGYVPGQSYQQTAAELHESQPEPGTVTVIERHFGPNRDVARVFWATPKWGSAEPRPATPEEVKHFCDLALMMWLA